ncbi:MAG: 23S rRNA (uracil(1939)-C(5))-methyltransferase RlmD [Burkholderiaceae bacterium]|nr:23S rRNA (uracil(1939)-C(5))-methyltransferase RlmD [Burkholderiaceae bacterium]
MQRLHSLAIESVDLEAQGLAHHEGKVVFVENALLGEVVDAEVLRSKPSYAKARAVAWHRESAQRVTPRCPHFGVCGGCSMQHIDPAAQLAIKQRVLEDSFWHIGRLKPEQIIAPLDGPAWGYRTRARLTARWVDKKGGMLLGFHERRSSYVAVMNSCEILHPRVAEMLPAMKDLLASLSIARRLPQAEVAVGEGEAGDGAGLAFTAQHRPQVVVWVLRILEPLSDRDEILLREFADQWQVQFWLQPGGPQTAQLFYPKPAPVLAYYLPEFDLRMPFSPVDFTQVNPAINQAMVHRAIDMLDCQPGDRVADLFCGLGNFTLALARRAYAVIGIEGSAALIARAQTNAELQGLSGRVNFLAANLFEVGPEWLQQQGHFDRMLLDPPREGAQAVCQSLAALHASGQGMQLPQRLVYVSCNPATLARDAAILVHEGGWHLAQAGVINMFPHTAHVESIAMFDRGV